jgi:hypothetical protein
MRKSLTWAAVGTTVAAAALGVAGTANASVAAPKGTSLSIEKSVGSVVYGGKVVISGQLKAGNTALDHQAVTLDWVGPEGHLHYITRGTTSGPTGTVSFTEHPTATTTYELVFAGAAGYAGSHSGKVTVPVSRVATALGLTAAPTTIEVGSEAALTGTLTAKGADVSGQPVFLDTVGKDGHLNWTGRVHNTDKGAVTFTVKPGSTTTYELVYKGNGEYKASHSAAAKVTVTKVPATLVATEAASTTPNEETITGTLTAGMKDLNGQAVTLKYENSKGKWVTLRSKSTSPTGVVTFTVAPKSATTYELVYTGNGTYSAATSNTVIAG